FGMCGQMECSQVAIRRQLCDFVRTRTVCHRLPAIASGDGVVITTGYGYTRQIQYLTCRLVLNSRIGNWACDDNGWRRAPLTGIADCLIRTDCTCKSLDPGH